VAETLLQQEEVAAARQRVVLLQRQTQASWSRTWLSSSQS
jgi:hypothetical protein